jgi:hypothetical protein
MTTTPRKGAGKHIRAALAAAFPSARFWVRPQLGWFWDVYVIRWTPGPSEEEVRKLANALCL